MEHDPSLVMLHHLADTLQQAGADRNLVEVAQHVLAVLDAFEARLDVLDDREGA